MICNVEGIIQQSSWMISLLIVAHANPTGKQFQGGSYFYMLFVKRNHKRNKTQTLSFVDMRQSAYGFTLRERALPAIDTKQILKNASWQVLAPVSKYERVFPAEAQCFV